MDRQNVKTVMVCGNHPSESHTTSAKIQIYFCSVVCCGMDSSLHCEASTYKYKGSNPSSQGSCKSIHGMMVPRSREIFRRKLMSFSMLNSSFLLLLFISYFCEKRTKGVVHPG
jgi:hypothetical protein